MLTAALVFVVSAPAAPPQSDWWSPAWSPGGREIAFIGTQGQLYVANVDGTGLRQLTRLGGDLQGADHRTWSPDGRKIAFDIDWDNPDGGPGQSEIQSIYVITRDGSGPRLEGRAASSYPSDRRTDIRGRRRIDRGARRGGPTNARQSHWTSPSSIRTRLATSARSCRRSARRTSRRRSPITSSPSPRRFHVITCSRC